MQVERQWEMAPGETLDIDGLGALEFFQVPGAGFRASHNEPLRIVFRQGGERCRPAGRSGSQLLKKLFQDYGVPPWVRDKVPLIYRQTELVAVGDLFVCEGFQVDDHEVGYLPQIQKNV